MRQTRNLKVKKSTLEESDHGDETNDRQSVQPPAAMTSEQIHMEMFGKDVESHSLAEMNAGIAKYIKSKHGSHPQDLDA